ncbi:uncharacterized protein LOC132899907 [Neoarius graeffei]|uniref:uncharacterized protein LOC132899907 n=1 Tax=Neoarius graeffei TaxID=443677 RepID=UPI00298CE923|nr:uncharacterized protein LOC132899907 [Neoarius graeffei]
MADSNRSVPFTHSENLAILEEFNSYKGVLLGKFNEECTNKKKHEVWKKITDVVNSVNPAAVRDVSAVQKRFKNMVQEAKNEIYKRKTGPPTGGGKAKKLKVTTEMVIEIYGGESPLFWGVKGGKESRVTRPSNNSPSNGETEDAPSPSQLSSPSACVDVILAVPEEEEPADQEEITVTLVPEDSQTVIAAPTTTTRTPSTTTTTRIPTMAMVLEKQYTNLNLEEKKLLLEIEVLQLQKQRLQLKLKRQMEE